MKNWRGLWIKFYFLLFLALKMWITFAMIKKSNSYPQDRGAGGREKLLFRAAGGNGHGGGKARLQRSLPFPQFIFFGRTQVEQYWENALSIIKDRVKEKSFNEFFQADTVARVEKHDSAVYIGVVDKYAKNAIETLYLNVVQDALCQSLGEEIRPIIVDISSESLPEAKYKTDVASAMSWRQPVFNPRYTFDSFVVGNSNRFAHAAAMAVAESPSHSYNPLFLYGGSGLGKTHLMHAIGQAVLQKAPGKKVVYVSAEAFTNEFISSVRESRLDAFKARYRYTDILLIDDIQFLAQKERTQEEFFHTFNALHDAGHQIVISSDRSPKELNDMEERLRSRFEWGLTTDIQPPDWETRCAILQRKAMNDHISVDNDVISLIADKVKTNIRELEGALNKLMYYCQLNNLDHADIATAQSVLQGMFAAEAPPKLTISRIQDVVADYYQVSVDDLKSKKKDRYIAYPRQIAMYFCREAVGATTPQIGRCFGGRDHTTVMYACDKIGKSRKTDPQLDHAIHEIEKTLKGNR